MYTQSQARHCSYTHGPAHHEEEQEEEKEEEGEDRGARRKVLKGEGV